MEKDEIAEGYNKAFLAYIKHTKTTSVDPPTDYKMQQDIYEQYASHYDGVNEKIQYQGFKICAEEVQELLSDSKDVRILDYGCGSGNVADVLVKNHGFKNIDGLDPCEEMLVEAKKKALMKNYYKLSSEDDILSVLSENAYDLVCSSGVFYVTPTHPDSRCVRDICKIVKPGGYIIIVTAEYYLKDADFKPIEELVKEKKLKTLPKKFVDEYRKGGDDLESGKPLRGIIFTYQVL